MDKDIVDAWNSLDGKSHLVEYADGDIERFDGYLELSIVKYN